MSYVPPPAEAAPATFSFLTTAYRTEDTLVRTIEAVRAQTRSDWELIVVDNGLSDPIAQIVSPYLTDPRIRLLRQENKGPTGGVMAAAVVATGRYVTVLNSDDAIAPQFCARMGDVVEADPGIAAVTCDAQLFVDPGMRILRRSYLETAGMRRQPDVGHRLRVADVIDGPCPYYSAVVRREVWEALGGMLCDTPIVDDLDFWLRALLAGHDIRMIPDRLALFRIEADSVSRPAAGSRVEVFEEQRERALIRAAEASGTRADAVALDRVLRRQHYERAVRQARVAFQSGDIPTARSHARRAFSLRRTARSGAIWLALMVSPRLLASLHPIKRRVQSRLAGANRSVPDTPIAPVAARAETPRKILVVTSRRIQTRRSGYDLRVASLCAHLPGELHLLVTPLVPALDPQPSLIDALFSSMTELPPLLAGPKSVRRHLRLSDDHFLDRTNPSAFAVARDRLQTIVRERHITHVVVFGGNLAELASTVERANILVDVCDSTSLTALRELQWTAEPPKGPRRWRSRLALHRARATEARFPDRFQHVTTISAQDSRQIIELHGSATNVYTIPNGVEESFLGALPSPGHRRGVAFWGNLGFGPNAEALRFFVHQVYLPVLREADVQLCVVGADAPAWLTELAAGEPRITLTGFVEDLGAAVGEYPIMINPMRTGSGLKNKVLEAFALGLAVVSTPIGIEALPEARDGTHFVRATDPASFGSAILELLADEPRRQEIRNQANVLVHKLYRWEVVARNWQSLFECDRTTII